MNDIDLNPSSPVINERIRKAPRTKAWAVHMFTTTGVVWGAMALVSLIHGHLTQMWLWLGIAMIVDGIDGSLARRAQVSRYAGWFDGVILDMIVDFMTWTFIPAVFMYLHLPWPSKPFGVVMLVVVLYSSVFCYCNKGMKSSDHYFVGFPAAWNIAALIMWISNTPVWVNVLATVTLALLTVLPLTFVHPFRVKHWRPANLVAVAIWVVTATILVATHPDHHWAVLALWWASGAWLMIVSAIRTFLGKAAQRKETHS